MENASKALIIAGAILLSILIIGIGVYIYNNASSSIKSADMSQQEIQQYNEPFTTYGGEHVSGSQAIALCNIVKTHNLRYQNNDPSKVILVTSGTNNAPRIADGASVAANEDASKVDTPNNIKAGLRSGYTYTIHFGYDPNSTLVTQIDITRRTT